MSGSRGGETSYAQKRLSNRAESSEVVIASPHLRLDDIHHKLVT